MSPADTPRSVAVHPADRLRALLSILPENPFYATKLDNSPLSRLCGRGAGGEGGFNSPLTPNPSPAKPGEENLKLGDLPFTTKADLIADQHAHPPYGTILTYPLAHYSRLHQTSGTSTGQPLCWLDTPESWQWVLDVWRQIFELMGVGNGDRLFFPFSFGPFLGFWGAFGAANACGYLALPGGGMSSAARLRFMLNHAATVVFCTPSYALHLAEVAGVEGLDLAASPVRMLVAAGEPGASVAATRERIETAWGARLFDHYGMTEIGPAAVECLENPGGMHVMAHDYIAEVMDPATGDALPPGAVGELVLTNLGRLGSPLVRYRTGDLVRIDREPCPCGRPWPRLVGGVLGRTDDMIHLRGNNLYPAALEAVIRRFAEVAEYRVSVDRTGPLADVRIELEPADLPAVGHGGLTIAERVNRAIRDELFFRADVVEVAPGTLPRFEMKAKRIINHETHEKRQN